MNPGQTRLVERLWASWWTDQHLALSWEKQPDAPS
jgi:hypothetical protein